MASLRSASASGPCRELSVPARWDTSSTTISDLDMAAVAAPAFTLEETEGECAPYEPVSVRPSHTSQLSFELDS